MAPGVVFRVAEMPVEPLRPWPPGAVQTLPPLNVQPAGAVAVRNLVKLSVVPEASERCSVEIAVLGSVTPVLSLAIAASFHLTILPLKMPAIVVGERFRVLTPGRL